MKKVLGGLVLALVVFLIALAVLPARIDPVEWEPSAAPKAEGVLALNDKLKAAVPLAPEVQGAEEISFDTNGNIITGLPDGRVVRMTAEGQNLTELVNTHGRPLGTRYAADGRLLIADAEKGLLALGADGKLEELVPTGKEIHVVDDLAIAQSGVIYYSDASTRFPFVQYIDDVFEHRGSGRVMRYDPATKENTQLATGLSFANGVALGPNDEYLLVNETGGNRIWRIWLTGAKSGQRDVFLDALPGFPDNLTWSPSRKVFWVALFGPRDPIVDGLAGLPLLRKMFSHLPVPPQARDAHVIAVDESGKIVDSLEWKSADSFSPITSVIERDGWLYLGSLTHAGIAKVKL
ncbi:MAG: SMP-30/gluconolactonase/LRE family protein [Myxococcaceae bacterium]